jgi:hypothetical protein
MAIRTPEDIDFSTFPESDGQPMAETHANAVQMVDLQWTLQSLFARQGRAATTAVGGNQFVYYNPSNGRDNISPDVYVIFDRPPPVPPKWQTWIEGKFPDIVFEITSPSTEAQDLSGRARILHLRPATGNGSTASGVRIARRPHGTAAGAAERRRLEPAAGGGVASAGDAGDATTAGGSMAARDRPLDGAAHPHR